MGIRFTCHACTKRLNVKAFLAGKRGYCPHCGAKVDIPLQSQSAGGASSRTRIPQHVGDAHSGGMNGSPGPAVAVPVEPARRDPSPASPAGNGHFNHGQTSQVPKAKSLHTASPAVSPVASPAPPTPAAAPDAIDEAPSAVWYVRPPSGGQFGPASGEIMRKWIGEGRVSADSLIWRDGWADWKTAGAVFPQLGGGAAAPTVTPPQPGPASPAPDFGLGPATPTSPSRPYTRRKNNNSLALVLVIVLTLAAIGLLVIFFAVAAWQWG